jgi:hypothetical protein
VRRAPRPDAGGPAASGFAGIAGGGAFRPASADFVAVNVHGTLALRHRAPAGAVPSRRRALKGEFQATAEPQDHRGSGLRSTLRAQPQGLVDAPSHPCDRPRNAGCHDRFHCLPEGKCRCRRSEHRRRPACASAPSNACAPVSARASRPSKSLAIKAVRLAPFAFSLIVFQNGHISGALAELIRSTRAPIKDRLIGKIMAGIRCFAARACRSTGSPSWCPRACARTPAQRRSRLMPRPIARPLRSSWSAGAHSQAPVNPAGIVRNEGLR